MYENSIHMRVYSDENIFFEKDPSKPFKDVCGYCYQAKYAWKEGVWYERLGVVSEGLCQDCKERNAEIKIKFLIQQEPVNHKGDIEAIYTLYLSASSRSL